MAQRHVHLLGIGGIGVGTVASLLLSRGDRVTGSDIQENAMIRDLRARGAEIVIGHRAENVSSPDCVVYSSAVKPDNPELIAARERGCRVMRRAEMLAALMAGYEAVTVAGAHGKTTTTGLAIHLLERAGVSPASALGGVPVGGGYDAALGTGRYFVAEVDESDGTLLYFRPDISIVTNIDREHLDFYRGWDHLCEIYGQYLSQTSQDGLAILYGDDEHLREAARQARCRIVFYGERGDSDIRLLNAEQTSSGLRIHAVTRRGEWRDVRVGLYGRHNALNALAVIALAEQLDLPKAVVLRALACFSGVSRRFEMKARAKGLTVVDDYAHHPTEIRSTVGTARDCGARRVIAVFQPHRYSRFQSLWDDFLCCFDQADEIIVTDVYAANEMPNGTASSEAFCQAMRVRSVKPVHYIFKDDIADFLEDRVDEGDYVLFLGAGDITRVAADFAGRVTAAEISNKVQ
ncbi:MAG: UDP-N-acetylmuramate--L-alanine ligase [Candidatus Omnitrophota bacterium]